MTLFVLPKLTPRAYVILAFRAKIHQNCPFGIQLDEYGLPLLNTIVNVSSRRPNMSSLPDGKPCISTVSLRGKSLDEINRLWLTDINAKRKLTEQLDELSALMRL